MCVYACVYVCACVVYIYIIHIQKVDVDIQSAHK
jgi:hypothetical protein